MRQLEPLRDTRFIHATTRIFFFCLNKWTVLQLTVLWGSMMLWTDELYILASTDTEHCACKSKVLSLKDCCRRTVTAWSYEIDLAAENLFMFLNIVFWFNDAFIQVCDELQLPLYTSYKVNIFFQSSNLITMKRCPHYITISCHFISFLVSKPKTAKRNCIWWGYNFIP